LSIEAWPLPRVSPGAIDIKALWAFLAPENINLPTMRYIFDNLEFYIVFYTSDFENKFVINT
jgi:hypothetical protein